MAESKDVVLLEKFLAGTATPSEEAWLREWAETTLQAPGTLDLMRAVWEQREGESLAALPSRDTRWIELREKMRAEAPHNANEDVLHRKQNISVRRVSFWSDSVKTTLHPSLSRGFLYAALCLIIGALGISIGWRGHGFRALVDRPTTVSTYATTNGERANIMLPDGTAVILGVASRLDVPADYAAGHRSVRLAGEALFTVTRHDGSPFTVTTGTTTARVLGTSFVVRHYATDADALIAVRDGKVAVGKDVVTAAQLAEVAPSGAIELRSADESVFSFATGILAFKSLPLPQAIVELDRWYAADIRLGDPSLEHISIGGKFTAGSLSDLTDVLELMLNVRVVRIGRTLTLYPKAR